MNDDSVQQSPAARDDAVLSAFLAGRLPADEIVALEERLDQEPALLRRLGELGRASIDAVELDTKLPEGGLSRLPTLSAPSKPRGSYDHGLEIGDVLGEGGMGIVYAANQQSLGRSVAVKTVRSKKTPTAALLEEALITGQLEHPNIVPIHDITLDDEGRPLVVYKRIEGKAWKELVEDPMQIAERYGVWNALEWHLGILVQVCQALRFAHSRGIIHRDVKPANVMIGAFDEVYLLDWGLALSVDGADDRLPSAHSATGMAGTPAYMAPEQFTEQPSDIGPHTDVYLVGATLYECIAGHPPQKGDTLRDVLDAIEAREAVVLPPDTPEELVQIVNRAMARDPADRYRSVQELRGAVEQFLQHRGSLELMEVADERSDIMGAAQERNDEETAERAFIEAAFGYRMALDVWSANDQARDKLNGLVDRRVVQLLDIHAPRAAQRALALSDGVDPELADEVDEALERERIERARLDALAQGDDRRVGHRVRRTLVIILGTAWIGWWISVGLDLPETLVPLLATTLVFWVVGIALIMRVRQQMLHVKRNRYITWNVHAMLTVQLLWLLAATMRGFPVDHAVTTLMLFWSLALATAAITVEVRILPTAVFYGLGFLLCSYEPAWLTWVLPLGAVFLIANMMAINISIARQAAEAERDAAALLARGRSTRPPPIDPDETAREVR